MGPPFAFPSPRHHRYLNRVLYLPVIASHHATPAITPKYLVAVDHAYRYVNILHLWTSYPSPIPAYLRLIISFP